MLKKIKTKFQIYLLAGLIVIIIPNIIFLKTFKHSLLLLAIFFLFVSIIFRKIIKKISNSIDNINKGLEKVGHGNISYRIEIQSNDEFVSLANRFNETGKKLESMMSELESAKKNLENQVNERTNELNKTNKKLYNAMEELKNTQNRIIQIEKQKSLTAIVSGFAHEINNPLSGILGYISLIEIRNDISPYLKLKLENIKNQALRIKDIIADLNQLNPEIEQIKLEINISNLIEKLIKIVSKKKIFKEIKFEKKISEDTIIVYGNHFALWQIFECMIENAIEAIKEKNIQNGEIQIVLKKTRDESYAVVEIIDNGGGFDNIEKAFDPFYTTKNRAQKKGIGLSIAFNLIQEHKGIIHISNNKKGATIKIQFPLFNINNKTTKTKTGG